MDDDIFPILEGWDYVPGEVTVRRFTGQDGREKVQLRLDLGLLQMETSGRPDGRRPFGAESLLKHYTAQRDEYAARHGNDLGFSLDSEACSELRNESLQYYYRYLSLFKLGDWAGVERDTARNLACLDFLLKYAVDDVDKFSLEQYRPYILMMHTRARAHRRLEVRDFEDALAEIRDGLAAIRKFFEKYNQPAMMAQSTEVEVLNGLASEVESMRPKDPITVLRDDLAEALRKENFEMAARLRDRIREMEGRPGGTTLSS